MQHQRELLSPLVGDADGIPIAPEHSGLRGTAPHGLSSNSRSPNKGGSVATSTHASGLKKNSLTLVHCLAMSITMIAPTVSIYFMSGQIASFAGASAPFVILLSAAISMCLASSILQVWLRPLILFASCCCRSIAFFFFFLPAVFSVCEYEWLLLQFHLTRARPFMGCDGGSAHDVRLRLVGHAITSAGSFELMCLLLSFVDRF
jgi:hypothetical protein